MCSSYMTEGYDAYFNGKDLHDNPYDLCSDEYNAWKKGYKMGEKEDIDHDPDGN